MLGWRRSIIAARLRGLRAHDWAAEKCRPMTRMSTKRSPASQHARNKATADVITYYRHSPKWPPRLRGGYWAPANSTSPGPFCRAHNGSLWKAWKTGCSRPLVLLLSAEAVYRFRACSDGSSITSVRQACARDMPISSGSRAGCGREIGPRCGGPAIAR